MPTTPPACQPLKCGCDVVYCPPTTCQPAVGCVAPIPFYPSPGCQAACLVQDEWRLTKPVQWVQIYRNHYVPIKIVKTPAQVDVQPVNIQVNERIVHYLCDCAPGTANCPHVPTGTPQTSGTSNVRNAARVRSSRRGGPAQRSTGSERQPHRPGHPRGQPRRPEKADGHCQTVDLVVEREFLRVRLHQRATASRSSTRPPRPRPPLWQRQIEWLADRRE